MLTFIVDKVIDSFYDTIGKILSDRMVIVGFVGQAMFTWRMIAQWIASERAGRSIVPNDFWWWSLFGSLTLLAYALYREDPVFILAQSMGSIVYIRNLALIRKNRTPKQS